MKTFLLVVMGLLVASCGAQASLLGAYDFSTFPVINLVTGSVGYNGAGGPPDLSSDNPHNIAGNTSMCASPLGRSEALPDGETDMLANNPDHNFTIDFWVKLTPDMITNAGSLMAIGSTSYGLRLGVNTSGKLGYRTAVGNADYGQSNAVLASDTWYHIAYQFQHVTGNYGYTRLYINGLLDYEAYKNGWLRGAGSVSTPLSKSRVGIIANLADMTTQCGVKSTYAYGTLFDDLRIYTDVLSADQIITDMNTPLGTVPEPGSILALLTGFTGIFLRKRSS